MTAPLTAAVFTARAKDLEASIFALEAILRAPSTGGTCTALDAPTRAQWEAWDKGWRDWYAQNSSPSFFASAAEVDALTTYEHAFADWQAKAAALKCISGPTRKPSDALDDKKATFWEHMAIAGAVIVGGGVVAYLVTEGVTVAKLFKR